MKKIVRELHVSRNTVRKILRSDETGLLMNASDNRCQ
ncbi:hypothetical protein [Rhizobium leguminosarum]